MAKPAKFTSEQILDSAQEVCLRRGSEVTVSQVAHAVDAPIGSIYHRFPSRHALLGALWARSVRRFHTGLFAAGEIEDPREAMAAMARHVPQFCRDNPGEAKAMTLFRRSELVELLPEEERADIVGIDDDVDALLREVTERRYSRFTEYRYRLAVAGTRQCPYGLVRPMVGNAIPDEFDGICVAAAEGILALGD